jgi:nitrite reductase/ring-hydroxylating ferredoxin subunit
MFLAHKSTLPDNSYIVLDQFYRKKVLVNDNGQCALVSNICPHQQSLISIRDGSGNRVCPYHSWSFRLDGSPIASGRTDHYCKNATALETEPVFEWNNLLFSCPVDFITDIGFENMVLMENRIDEVNAQPENIMDLFLDVDHIQSVHAGVYDLVDITNTDVQWEYYADGSVQIVDQCARWIAVYPNTMIEWQKGSLFITVAVPWAGGSRVIVYKYVDKHFVDHWKLNEMVWETAWAQDKEQAQWLTTHAANNLEPQKRHYREYLRLNGTDKR